MEGIEVRKLLAENIKRLRNNLKMSQADLAFDAEISIPFLSDIERANKWPHPDTLAKIATVLKVQVYELFFSDTNSSNKEIIYCKKIISDILAAQKRATETVYNNYFKV